MSDYQQLLAAIREHSGMGIDEIKEAGEHGADTGWPGFTYTINGAEFTRKNEQLVYDLLAAEADEYDMNVASFVASFKRSDMADSRDGYDCLLSWWALETVGRLLNDGLLAVDDEDDES